MQSNQCMNIGMRARVLTGVGFTALSVGSAVLARLALPGSGLGLALPGLAAAGAWAWVMATSERSERPGLVAASILLILQLGLVVGATRVATLALALTDGSPDLGAHGLGAHGLGAPSLAPALLAAVLVLALAWAGLDRRGLEPSAAAKSSLGFVGLAVSCTCLAAGLEFAGEGQVLAHGAASACVLALVLALAIVGPDCLQRLLAYVPTRTRAAALTSWTLALLGAQALAQATPLPSAFGPAFGACLTMGFAALAAAVLCSFMWRPVLNLAGARPGRRSPNSTLDLTLAGTPAHTRDAAR